ncbi:MAG: hypothetical protein ACOYJ1_09170 [Peptococcales bacterium]|jgi:hypothetical protein
MKNYVEGQLVGQYQMMNDKMKKQLESLGYQVSPTKFRKYGQVESVVNELVPYIEKEGINTFQNLHLEEFSSEGKLVGKYENGRVTRFEDK